tara:strand:+ start:1534 stop:2250 length:717 start_codon:yes stop_codon:yes gene_type:complete
MKLLLENWKKYLTEDENDLYPFQIYCDLDGVLVGFEEGAAKLLNEDLADPSRVEPKHKKKYDKMVEKLRETGRPEPLQVSPDDFSLDKEKRLQAVRNYMYPRLQDNVEFWANLDWQRPDGLDLWNYIEELDPPPYILTAPMRGDPEGGDHRGKREWVAKNLGIADDRVIIEREKHKHATGDDGKPNILIDDTPKKINAWKEAGGIGILHQHGTTDATIAKLENLKEGIIDSPDEEKNR